MNDPKSGLDTLNHYEKILDKTEASGLLKKFRLLAYLDIAKRYFMGNQPQEGEKYLTLFESGIQLPLDYTCFKVKIENTYYEYARYYVRFNHRATAQKIVNRGLKYIPNSNMIQSATYVIPSQKPNIIQRKMTKAEYDKYMKKKAIDN